MLVRKSPASWLATVKYNVADLSERCSTVSRSASCQESSHSRTLTTPTGSIPLRTPTACQNGPTPHLEKCPTATCLPHRLLLCVRFEAVAPSHSRRDTSRS